jgi:hypothetical protein
MMLRNLTCLLGCLAVFLAAVSVGGASAQEAAPPCHSRLISGGIAHISALLSDTGSSLCVQGGPAAVQLEVRRTTIAAALSALFAAYQVSYRSTAALDEERDGTFRGSLRYVISRLLEGYNYVIKQQNSNLAVIIFNKKGQQAIPGQVITEANQNRVAAQVSRNH